MKLALWTREDPASMRAARALLAQGRFAQELGAEGARLDAAADAALLEVKGSMLAADFVDRRAAEALGRPVTRCIFLSKHSAASKIRTFTVHPIGNLGPGSLLRRPPADPLASRPRGRYGAPAGPCGRGARLGVEREL